MGVPNDGTGHDLDAPLSSKASGSAQTPLAESLDSALESVTAVREAPARSPSALGRYELLQQLGEGGMGAVYLARDPQLERLVALKVPRIDSRDRQSIERFMREARLAARLQRHPNVCPIYDVGETSAGPYLAMMYIEGTSLTQVLKDKGPLPEEQALFLVRKIALGMSEAHRQGVLHRDLKPSNIMIDKAGEPVIMDFGLARDLQTHNSLTAPGQILGTFCYMAPEQAGQSTSDLTWAADVYSLGVILFELLTAHRPFEGPPSRVLYSLHHSPPPPLGQFRQGLRPELQAICDKALAKRPQDRFQTMDDFAAQLQRLIEPERPSTPSGSPAHDPSSASRRQANRPLHLSLRHTLRGHSDRIGHLAWSRNGRLLATPSDDGSVRIWNLDNGNCQKVLKHPLRCGDDSMPSLSLPGEALCVSWSRTGRRIVVGYADGDAYIRKINDDAQSIVLPGDRGATSSVSWSPGGNCIATGGLRGTVRLWDAGHGTLISQFALDDAVTALAMSDAALAVTTRHGRLHFLLTEPQFSRTHPFESRADTPADAPLTDDLLRSNPPAVLTAVAWSHDTKRLAIAADSDVILWNFRRQAPEGRLEGDRSAGPIGSVSFSADDRLLAAKSSHQGLVRIWHVATRTLLSEFEERGDPRLLEGHPTSGLAFHPSLPMLATLDHRDRWVRVWDYEEGA